MRRLILNESIEQEDVTLVNIYALNIGAPKYIKNIVVDVNGENNSSTVIVRDL